MPRLRLLCSELIVALRGHRVLPLTVVDHMIETILHETQLDNVA
jgi:hypothetical protein